jgi:aldehyde dehydrogenase (NAD+)
MDAAGGIQNTLIRSGADLGRFYIGGAWASPRAVRMAPLVDPATGQQDGQVALGNAQDVADAVAAARAAFPTYAATTRTERLALLRRIIEVYKSRAEEMARAITREMGAPMALSRDAHVPFGLGHLEAVVEVLETYRFEEVLNRTVISREAFGVCAFITPWNWPMNQIACKVAPALAAGCTMILKPSEIAPRSGQLFAEILDEAGVPAGVFNLVHGDGEVGQALSSHPDVDLVSFTGSTPAGIMVAKSAADTVKRVHQELGGKSPCIVMDDNSFGRAVRHGARLCFNNSGQSCNAPTRMLVPAHRMDEAAALATEVAQGLRIGLPTKPGTQLGPVVSQRQCQKIRALIEQGVAEGARLVTGGPDPVPGLDGFYVAPTVFADVTNDMTIAREEIFGPVLSIIPYGDVAEAVRIANDSVYGLCAYVTAEDIGTASKIARQLRAGMVHLNGQAADYAGAFGGYKQSGNGREWGLLGFEEFLETKSIFGDPDAIPA